MLPVCLPTDSAPSKVRLCISRCLQCRDDLITSDPSVITPGCSVQVSEFRSFNIHEEEGGIFLTEGFMEKSAFIDFLP